MADEPVQGFLNAYLLDLGRIGDWQQMLRAFYVSVLGALIGLLTLAGGERAVFPASAKVTTGLLVCGAGLVVCVMWFLHMSAFRSLFAAKFATLRGDIEAGWTVQPFTAERERLRQAHYAQLTIIDQVIPLILALTFALLIVLT